MAKLRRIFDIAKELNISHIEIINFLDTEGIKATIMSTVSNEDYAKILDQFYQEKSQVDRLRKEKARLNVVHHNQDRENQSEILDNETNAAAQLIVNATFPICIREEKIKYSN